jgi:hypothetical protein
LAAALFSPVEPRELRLAVLCADRPCPPVQERFGDYADIFAAFLQRSAKHCLAAAASKSRQENFCSISVDRFNAVEGELPVDPSVYDGLIVSGSSEYPPPPATAPAAPAVYRGALARSMTESLGEVATRGCSFLSLSAVVACLAPIV